LKERQAFDDGDPLQSASPKVLVFDYTRFGICVMCMAPLLMLIDSFKRKGNVERESIKYLAEKKRLEMSSLGI
jgi:hypothetical protein